uniref:Uncharacterized protein n=1 Tax=Populus alba TaxID=43335 RepID=A0A4U5PQH0_POPAL|nr:hypothetical protein D5086_0000199930 [Populus alba]
MPYKERERLQQERGRLLLGIIAVRSSISPRRNADAGNSVPVHYLNNRMGKDKFTASDSNMKNDVESASASTIEEDRASASDIDDDTNYGIEMIWSPDWRVTWGYLKGLIKEVPTQKDRAGECCIYRVPNSLRDRNPEAFSPQLISIGPFHCDHERGQSMKHIYLREFLKRNAMDDKLFTNFLRRIQKKEKSIRLCYSASFFTYTQEFVEMIVLDAVFIIEFLKDSYDDAFPQTVDTRMISCIGEDLMLPENQLPFSVIDSIYSEFYQDEQNITFLNLATRHFGNALTHGARALAKHAERSRDRYWGILGGSDSTKNRLAMNVISRLIVSCCWSNIHVVPQHGAVFEIRVADGYGARWSKDGTKFIGFLEPYIEDGHSRRWKH